MQFVFLFLGTILLVFLFVMINKGKQYESYIENLDDFEHPLKEVYIIGYGWHESNLIKFSGKIRADLISQAKLIYEDKYAEYYAMLVWVQVISFVHLSLAIGFILAGLVNFPLLALVGILAAFLIGYYFLTKMKTVLEERKTECVIELPEIVSTMALLMNSGMVLREAWEKIAYSKDGAIYELMRATSEDMKNGMTEMDAFQKFGILSNSPDIKKFTSSLIQGLEKGSSELSLFLTKQSSELWGLKKQIMLQKGEAAASKLLAPIGMIFVGIIIIVAAAAIGMLM